MPGVVTISGGAVRGPRYVAGGGGGGGGTLDMMATAWNRTGSTHNNRLVILPVWADEDQWLSGDALQVYADSGGSAGSEIAAYQVDNIASSRSGDKRLGFVALIDSFTANQTKKYHAKATAGSAPTGTAIAVSDVTALTALANGGVKVTATIGGTAYEAKLSDAIAGSTTYSKTAASRWISASDSKNWRQGCILTEFVCSIPFKAVSGGAAHAFGDGMHAKFECMAWKGGTGAVGSNPILGLCVRVVVWNAKGDGTEYTLTSYTIERATSLSDGTLISTNDTDWRDGRTIDYTLGNPLFYPGGSDARYVHIGDKPYLALPGDHTISAGEPTTNALMMAVSGAKLLPFWNKSFASITHSVTSLNNRNVLAGNTGETDHCGEVLYYMPSTGGRADINIVPNWDLYGLVKPTQDGLRRIFENAECFGSIMHGYGARRPDSGLTYPEPNSGQTNRTLTEGTNDPWTYDLDHAPEGWFTAYILAGSHHDLTIGAGWVIGRHNTDVLPVNATMFGSAASSTWDDETESDPHWKYFQVRGMGWSIRTQDNVALALPDRQTSGDIFAPSKSSFQAVLQNTWTRAANCISRGNTLGYYDSGRGLKFIEQLGGNKEQSIWMFSYVGLAIENARRHGNGDSNLTTLLSFVDDHFAGFVLDESVVWPWLVANYRDRYQIESTGAGGAGAAGARIKTFSAYRDELAARRPINESYHWTRAAPAGVTVTLSATSGASVTVTFSSNIINMTYASHYVDKWFAEHSAGDNYGSGFGKITAVGAANQITIDTTVTGGAAFTGTSLAAARWSLPQPHPSDTAFTRPPVGYGVTLLDFSYGGSHRSYLAMRKDAGATDPTSAFNAFDAWYPISAGWADNWLWDTRP